MYCYIFIFNMMFGDRLHFGYYKDNTLLTVLKLRDYLTCFGGDKKVNGKVNNGFDVHLKLNRSCE